MAVYRVHGEHRDALIAGEDLSDKLLYAASLNANKEIIIAPAGSKPVGFIFQTAPLGRPATIAVGGMVNAVAGGAIAAGDYLEVDANGKVITSSTPGEGFGPARSSTAAADEVVEFYFN